LLYSLSIGARLLEKRGGRGPLGWSKEEVGNLGLDLWEGFRAVIRMEKSRETKKMPRFHSETSSESRRRERFFGGHSEQRPSWSTRGRKGVGRERRMKTEEIPRKKEKEPVTFDREGSRSITLALITYGRK